MKVSRNWLQKYIKGDLPSGDELGALLTKHSFEIEGVDDLGNDSTIDIDVLNNRAHDCLSHYGVAKEISILTGGEFVSPVKPIKIEGLPSMDTKINSKDCKRIALLKIEGIDNSIESPAELKEALESIGERSINFIVDVTNFVMYELGQPMHAYDADKLDGAIEVRQSKESEKIITLDKREVELNPDISVVADQKGPLAIAGVKGGNKAEVTKDTTSIVLEAANFTGSSVRKSSGITGIRTDSSKRFENEITPRFISGAISRAVELIKKYGGSNISLVAYDDVYPNKTKAYRVGVSVSEISKRLGVDVSKTEIEEIISRFGWKYEIVNPKEKFLEVIESAIGKPYKYGASVLNDSPERFDCSSLTAYAAVCAGIRIPRMVVDQYAWSTPIEEKDLEVGDLVFSNIAAHGHVMHRDASYESVEFMPGTKFPEGVDHMGVYVGNGELIHATEESDRGVVREKISESPRFGEMVVGYRRLIQDNEERIIITIPHERIDLRIKEDIIEEIGRIYGYEKIDNKSLGFDFNAKINPIYYWDMKVREILVDAGFSEVYTYTFQKKGDIEVAKPFAKDKSYLRKDLSKGIIEALDTNEYYSDLIGIRDVQIFEIGHVFDSEKESSRCAVAIRKGKGRKKPSSASILRDVISKVEEVSGIKLSVEIKDQDEVVEFDMAELYKISPHDDKYGSFYSIPEDRKYKIPSSYPFITRDIAIWVPGSDMQEEMQKLLVDNAGDLLVTINLFDIYTKEEKDSRRTSYAYRLVFQSQDRTLSDDEVNSIMDKIYSEISKKEGWEVR